MMHRYFRQKIEKENNYQINENFNDKNKNYEVLNYFMKHHVIFIHKKIFYFV